MDAATEAEYAATEVEYAAPEAEYAATRQRKLTMNQELYNISAAHLAQKITIISEDRVRDAAAALAHLIALESLMGRDFNDLCIGLTNHF